MTCTCELNVRLDAIDLPNDQAAIERRAGDALAVLQRFGAVAHRRVATSSAHTLVAQVVVDDLPHDALHSLAEELHQDCLAIYYPATGEGRLVGPRAGRWGRFRVAGFERYAPAASSAMVTATVDRHAREWIARRDRLVEARSSVRRESGVLLADKAESLVVDLLPEPLRSAVERLDGGSVA